VFKNNIGHLFQSLLSLLFAHMRLLNYRLPPFNLTQRHLYLPRSYLHSYVPKQLFLTHQIPHVVSSPATEPN